MSSCQHPRADTAWGSLVEPMWRHPADALVGENRCEPVRFAHADSRHDSWGGSARLTEASVGSGANVLTIGRIVFAKFSIVETAQANSSGSASGVPESERLTYRRTDRRPGFLSPSDANPDAIWRTRYRSWSEPGQTPNGVMGKLLD
jgi:hypothetical protein